MIQLSKETDEVRTSSAHECWCLHGAVGLAQDWRATAKALAGEKIGTRAVDLWRFLECNPLPLADFGKVLNADAQGRAARSIGRSLLGYSLGGRLALHALLENPHPWSAAIIVSAHPGLESLEEQAARRAHDTEWASKALTAPWQEFQSAWNAQPVLRNSLQRDPQAVGQFLMRRREIARSFVDWSLGSQTPLWSRLKEIDIPVLWIAGERDEKFLALAEKAVSSLPNGHLSIAPGAGHRVPWEAPVWFHETVAGFLR
ncbi:MAG: alpha/beta fold hydrolase [Luteolibacter sp.]